jgi:hypothetical protein
VDLLERVHGQGNFFGGHTNTGVGNEYGFRAIIVGLACNRYRVLWVDGVEETVVICIWAIWVSSKYESL